MGGGQWLLLRRQMLKKKGNDEEMKEWVTLADASKTVENLSTIEFDLVNADFHDEFRCYLEIGKNANTDGKQHNLKIGINGMYPGYFLFNTKWDANYNRYFEIEKSPKAKMVCTPFTSYDMSYNTNQLSIQLDYIGTETGTGKLVFEFPSDYKYTGTIKVQLYAR